MTPRPKRILVVGGGIAGLAALRALVEEGGTSTDGPFQSVELIERRDNIGGVWYLDENVVKQEKSYPGGTASGQWPVPIKSQQSNGVNGHTAFSRPSWPSPAYPALRGNVLPRFLSLAGAKPFPSSSDPEDPYPTLAETQDYLECIAKPLRSHIRFNVECLDIRELSASQQGKNKWAVRVRDWNVEKGGQERTEYYDAVVLSVGWTDQPAFPRLPGLEEAKALGVVQHAKWYRGPEPYSVDSRVVVVGNGNSGNDVAAHLASTRTLGKHEPVYRVARHKPWFFYVSLPDPLIKDVPSLESFTAKPNSRKVDVKLVDGTILTDVDHVILASGYEIGKFPYVHLLARTPGPEDQSLLELATRESPEWQYKEEDGSKVSSAAGLWENVAAPPRGTSFNVTDNLERIPQLYHQFLHSRAGTLAFINLSVTSVPFWTSDLQSHVLRAIWDGSLTTFPDKLEDRVDYETKRLAFLAQYKAQEPDRIKVAQEQLIEEQKKAGDQVYVPPEHTGGPPYHILGTIVDDYATALRALAISAKPEWEKKLPDWPAHAEERNGMYALKRAVLEKKAKRKQNGSKVA